MKKITQSRKELIGFLDFFKKIPDHRVDRQKLHSVEEILLVAFCAIIAGCEGWADIELFGKTRIDFFRTFLPFPNGIPSDDTFRRFFRVLDPKVFESHFLEWIKSLQLNLESKVVAIDGKTDRRSFDGDQYPLHLLSAYATEIGLVLGQEKVADKSNEITAIPKLLDVLDVSGAIVTIDAIGCQLSIANKIIDKKANYLLALKGNQARLYDDVKLFFEERPSKFEFPSYEEVDNAHGRIETRRCTVNNSIGWLNERYPEWRNMQSIVEIEATRKIKNETTTEKRYYISSLKEEPAKILTAVRQHWGIENQLHWVLDVCFGSDQSRIRKGNAPHNVAVIRRSTFNLLKQIKKDYPRISIKQLRKLAGWDNNFLSKVLFLKI
ncbi:MAG: ISAs1 family transposase [Alphaproteobacteria bacterium]|nr:MAG: ISAs1 family transposase [Alphaproteobacteria bacterium]